MPRKPWRVKGAKGTLHGPTELHLLTGCCLLGGGCQVCHGNMAKAHGLPPWSLREGARETWERHRERLLAVWNDPAGRQPKASGFSAEAMRGAGRLGVPCFAELVFDGAPLPALTRAWPADVQKAWRTVRDEYRSITRSTREAAE